MDTNKLTVVLEILKIQANVPAVKVLNPNKVKLVNKSMFSNIKTNMI